MPGPGLGWAGDDAARALPTLQSLPSAGCHPPNAGPTREGAPTAKQQGVQGISPGPCFHPPALDLDLGLSPACSVFSHNEESSGLFVSPTYPHPSLMLCPLRLWLAQKGSQVWTSITREETRLPCLRASPLPAAAPPAWPATTWPGCPLDKANTNGGGQSVALPGLWLSIQPQSGPDRLQTKLWGATASCLPLACGRIQHSGHTPTAASTPPERKAPGFCFLF